MLGHIKAKGRYAAVFFIGILLIIIITVMTMTGRVRDGDNKDYLPDISQGQLKSKIRNKDSFFVYIGRPTCPDCREFYPELKEILYEENVKIYYYNTKCKASEKKAVRSYYNSLGVMGIPSIVKIKNGNVEKIYNGQSDEDMGEFKEEITMGVKGENK